MSNDRRLVWNQLSQPQANVAGLMANANNSFNDGLTAAQDILGKYDTGVKEKGDQELARLLAGATSQDELTSLANSDAIRNLRLSGSGTEMLNRAQRGIADYQNIQSTISDRAGRLGLARNQDARVQGDWDWNDGARREEAGLVDEVVAARLEGQNYGSAGRPGSSAFDNYIASTIQSESGGRSDAKNPKSSATGLGQFIDSTWQEMMAKHPDLGLTADGRTDPEQSRRALVRFTEDNAKFLNSAGIETTEGNLYAAHFLGRGGARAVLSSNDNANVADILPSNVIAANDFLKGMTVGDFRKWSAQKGGSNAPGGSRTPARDTLQNAVANSQYLSLDQVNTILNGNDSNVAQGDKKLADQLAQTQQDLLASFISETVSNPEIVNSADAARAVEQAALASGEFSQSEALNARKAAEAMIGESGSLSAELAPTVAEDVRFNNIIEGTNQDTQRGLDSTVIGRMTNDISQFSEADSVTAGLEAALGPSLQENAAGAIGGFLTPGKAGANSNDITNLINRYAAQFKVSPEVAAAAMREAFVDDPLTVAGFGANTLERRFDQDAVGKIIEEYTNQESQSKFGDDNRTRKEFDQKLNTLNKDVQKLQVRAAKTKDPNERRQIAEEISRIYVEMSAIRSEAQSLYRGGTTPSSK